MYSRSIGEFATDIINEVRKNPISGSISIVATARRYRPKSLKTDRSLCPFCPGNEQQNPPPTAVLTKKDGQRVVLREYTYGWLARIFPNKYPAVTPNPPETSEPGFSKAYGYHEVLVETPKHVPDIHLIPTEELADGIWLGLHRIRKLFEDPEIKSCILVKNRGIHANASIEHTHFQMFALPFIPPRLEIEVNMFSTKSKPLCRHLEEEIKKKKRVIYIGQYFAVLAITAPRVNHEIWVIPLKHEETALNIKDPELLELAKILQTVTRIYVEVLNIDSYNIWFHMAPKNTIDFHWHVEVAPALLTWGGLEKSSDTYLIEVPPEETAKLFTKYFEYSAK
uniref:DUF4921 family protein n=1 Tax=Ignisphaera aggregans TaxID=334771 RepID=A0A7C2ZRJ3_9CREN